MAKDPQVDRMAQAVERKKKQAKKPSQRPPPTPRGSPVKGDEPDLYSPSRPQDEYSPRAKGTRHRKVTADKWNQ
jgi:hypothetical protein